MLSISVFIWNAFAQQIICLLATDSVKSDANICGFYSHINFSVEICQNHIKAGGWWQLPPAEKRKAGSPSIPPKCYVLKIRLMKTNCLFVQKLHIAFKLNIDLPKIFVKIVLGH